MNLKTHAPIKLTEANLSQLSPEIRLPQYDRHTVTPGIVHIGVGGFHRAHQAVYLDDYFHQSDDKRWGIVGVGLLEWDQRMRDALQSQDCLYTLVERSAAGDRARIIGSIRNYLYAPDNRQAVVDALASPDCKIVTLTITEAGYYYIEGTGELDVNHPTIQYDLQHPDQPIGAYGFLIAALDRRRQSGLPPFTILSCDNIQGNGNVTRKMVTAYAELANPELAAWIRENVTFPNSMVDRITPATTDADRAMVAEQFGIQDGFPVVTEPFIQWVIEDQFCAGRPAWETVGAQFTNDVHSYEKIKIRLLNGSHLLIGYLGELAGYRYVHEVMADPPFLRAVEHFMEEVTSTLKPVPGMELTVYKRTLIERFSNPRMPDQLPRLCLNGAAKMPKFVLGSVRDRLQQSASVNYLGLVVAAWCRYLQGTDDQGRTIEIDDPMAAVLTERAQNSDAPRSILNLTEIFGEELPQSQQFVEAVTAHFNQLRDRGVKATLADLA
ncbi:mannitol dehydrogenase family protein [Leptolyngbya ohadii]|uniref:mannitol dehydrogenase family protein n=1 Tax=Leptolyngbya ohadii TaxID=1962290 RepID=UPI000B59CC1C|nr:mannitol dehydrogenase family protein [Leptolyngbya ohadii]